MGHADRVALKNKIKKLQKSPLRSLDENFRVLIKKGPVSVETSLKELEEIYAGQWCIIRLTCSHPELTKDHVLTTAYVIIF